MGTFLLQWLQENWTRDCGISSGLCCGISSSVLVLSFFSFWSYVCVVSLVGVSPSCYLMFGCLAPVREEVG